MALDARIPLMAQGMNLEPRSNALMRAAQLQGTQDTNALRQMQMQQIQQAAQQTMMDRQAAAQKQAQLEAALKAIPSPQGQAIASLGRNASPTNANAQRMPQVDPRAQQLWEMMQAGLVKPKEYMDVAYQQPEFMVAGPGSGIVDKRTGSVKSNIPFKPEAQKLPAVGELQAFRDGLPEGDPRKREVQGVIDNMTRPPKYASAPAGPAAGGATMPPPKKAGPMSVTLQKELLESDDLVKSSSEVVRALESAKKQNLDAYSGYLAKPRAVLRSNLPGESAGADATIDIDNLMTGQGLEQMKSIFGAAPTEGERKILLEMQASVDKTPKQREAIMDRAIAAAKRRAEYATKKAAAIRDGSYLTDGIPETQEAPPKPAGKTVKRTGTSNGRKVVEYTDGSIEYAD